MTELEKEILEKKCNYEEAMNIISKHWSCANTQKKEEILELYADLSGKSIKQIYNELNCKSSIPKTSEELEKIDRKILNKSKSIALIILQRNSQLSIK